MLQLAVDRAAGGGFGRVLCEPSMNWIGKHTRTIGIRVGLRTTAAGVAGVLGIMLLAHCNRETSAGAGESPATDQVDERTSGPIEATPAALGPGAASEKAGQQSAGARVSEANFDLSVQPTGNYQVGQKGSVKVVLDAKGVYKVNDEYPYKFKLEPNAGLEYAQDVVKKDAVKLEKKRATMTVSLTPKTAGKQRLAGKFYFSICTDEKCLIEKRDLALDIEVK